MPLSTIRAITLDLDDTLWPVWPTIVQAERAMYAYLQQAAPATTQRFDRAALRGFRDEVARDRPDWAHDFSAMRRESVRRALLAAGDDPALAEPAFEVFFEARQSVVLFDDVLPALARLAARYPLLGLTNGNAQLARIGLDGHFQGCVSAREFGVGKPDGRIFAEACRLLGCAPGEVLHVGDDWALDVAGAHAAGLLPVWVKREGVVTAPAQDWPAEVTTVPDLMALVELLGC